MCPEDEKLEGFGKRHTLDPDDFYYTPEGYIVFTAKYLLRRGYCCKSGCRHCPYGYNAKTGGLDKKNRD